MKLRRFVLIPAVVLAGGLALSGCSPDASAPSPSVSESQQNMDVRAGDRVTADVAERLNAAEGTLRAYGMMDGTFVVVDSSVPLPGAVRIDMESRLAEIPLVTGPENSQAVADALGDFVFRANAETGRTVVVVTKLWAEVGDDASVPRTERWVNIGGGEVYQSYGNYRGTGTYDEYLDELHEYVIPGEQDGVELFQFPPVP